MCERGGAWAWWKEHSMWEGRTEQPGRGVRALWVGQRRTPEGAVRVDHEGSGVLVKVVKVKVTAGGER